MNAEDIEPSTSTSKAANDSIPLDKLPDYDHNNLGPYYDRQNPSVPHTYWRNCFVPKCKNTTKSAPDKMFIHIPTERKRRKLWASLCGRAFDKLSDKSHFAICEDHFDVPNDVDNYMKFKLGFTSQVKVKPGAFPQYFDCQGRSRRPKAPAAVGNSKLDRKQRIKQLFEALEKREALDAETEKQTKGRKAETECQTKGPRGETKSQIKRRRAETESQIESIIREGIERENEIKRQREKIEDANENAGKYLKVTREGLDAGKYIVIPQEFLDIRCHKSTQTESVRMQSKRIQANPLSANKRNNTWVPTTKTKASQMPDRHKVPRIPEKLYYSDVYSSSSEDGYESNERDPLFEVNGLSNIDSSSDTTISDTDEKIK